MQFAQMLDVLEEMETRRPCQECAVLQKIQVTKVEEQAAFSHEDKYRFLTNERPCQYHTQLSDAPIAEVRA